MYVWKPLTKVEVSKNERFPDKAQIKPHAAFYINESKFKKESKLWHALGFANLCEITKSGKLYISGASNGE